MFTTTILETGYYKTTKKVADGRRQLIKTFLLAILQPLPTNSRWTWFFKFTWSSHKVWPIWPFLAAFWIPHLSPFIATPQELTRLATSYYWPWPLLNTDGIGRTKCENSKQRRGNWPPLIPYYYWEICLFWLPAWKDVRTLTSRSSGMHSSHIISKWWSYVMRFNHVWMRTIL